MTYTPTSSDISLIQQAARTLQVRLDDLATRMKA